MPSLPSHEQQYTSNEAFYRTLNDIESEQYDWFIIIHFYTILHYADAFCAKNNNGHIKFGNHKEREQHLRSLVDRKHYMMYLQLKEVSRLVRYDAKYIGNQARNHWLNAYKELYQPLRSFFTNSLS